MTSGQSLGRQRGDCATLAAVVRGGLTLDSGADDWLALRIAAGAALASQEAAVRVIADAPSTDDPWTRNLVAGVAERIAAAMGVPIPDWCQQVAPLAEPWEPDGTPTMLRRWRRDAILELRRRGILIETASLWSDV